MVTRVLKVTLPWRGFFFGRSLLLMDRQAWMNRSPRGRRYAGRPMALHGLPRECNLRALADRSTSPMRCADRVLPTDANIRGDHKRITITGRRTPAIQAAVVIVVAIGGDGLRGSGRAQQRR